MHGERVVESLMEAYYQAIADEAAVQSDALYPNDPETLHPDYYTIQAEDLPSLVKLILELSRG